MVAPIGLLPKFLVVNARSILNKKEELEVIISHDRTDVIFLLQNHVQRMTKSVGKHKRKKNNNS